MTTGRPWSAVAGGMVVTVRLTPKGGRDVIEGIDQLADGSSVLKVRVRAVPQAGEANAALVKLLAKSLGVAQGRVQVLAGAASRIKRIKIEGDAAALTLALETILR